MKSSLLMMRAFAPGLTKSLIVGVAAVSAFLFGGSPQSQPADSTPSGFTSFDATGAGTKPGALQGTASVKINASGETVGIVTDLAGVHHGMVRTADGTITKFDAVGAGTSGNQGTLALGINAGGDVTGYYTDSQQAQHSFIRTADGTVTNFDVPVAGLNGYNKGTNAIGINDNGDVTGQYYNYTLGVTPIIHGFLRLKDGAYTTFDAPNAGDQPNTGTTPVAINASGVIAGYVGDAKRVLHGFVRGTDGTITLFDSLGAGTGRYQGTIVTALDASGDASGISIDSIGAVHGFIRSSGGTITTFDALGAGTGMLQGTFPLGINSSGTIVGFYFDAKYVLHEFMRTANGVFFTFDAPNAGTGSGTSGDQQTFQGTGAFGINDAGAITGSYLDVNSVSHGFIVAAPAVVPATFAVTGSAVSLSPGATSGNTATITVTPSGNFTGPVALTASVTASPAGAIDPPTLSFGSTTPVAITGATAGTANLTISTTAASSASLAKPGHRELRPYYAGGAALACMLFFGVPARKRGWMRLFCFLLMLGAIGGVMIGCSSSGSGPIQTGPTNSGTTAGSYTVTVTGTSGATTSAGTLTLTVQ